MNGPGLTSAGAWRKPCSNYPHEGLLPLDSCGSFTAADERALRFTGGPSAATPSEERGGLLIDTYGEVLPAQDPEVARAHRVFERVRAVADKNSNRLPQLVVVNSRADPWAIALPDGHIVLSKQAVALCHRQVNLAEAKARLAFVLGHELAHLAHDDFWHHEAHGFLAAHTAPSTWLTFCVAIGRISIKTTRKHRPTRAVFRIPLG